MILWCVVKHPNIWILWELQNLILDTMMCGKTSLYFIHTHTNTHTHIYNLIHGGFIKWLFKFNMLVRLLIDFFFVCLSVCWSVCFLCLFVCLFIYFYAYMLTCKQFAFLSILLPACISVCLLAGLLVSFLDLCYSFWLRP